MRLLGIGVPQVMRPPPDSWIRWIILMLMSCPGLSVESRSRTPPRLERSWRTWPTPTASWHPRSPRPHTPHLRLRCAPPRRPRTAGSPIGLRTLAGSVVDDAVVLDAPWFAAALDPAQVVVLAPRVHARRPAGRSPRHPDRIGGVHRRPGRAGRVVDLAGASRGAADGVAQDRALPDGPIRVHDRLMVELRRGDDRTERRVPWWRDENGMVHVDSGFHVLAD